VVSGTNPGDTVSVEQRVPEIVRLLASGKARPRLRMQGVSMLPMLCEGMVLELGPFNREAVKVGDVVVFLQEETLVAHRVIGFSRDGLQTSGDNRPGTVEDVRFHELVGVVEAVYESDAPDAKRLDDAPYRRRGELYARTRGQRFAARRAVSFGERLGGAAPWSRQRLFGGLRAALTGYVRADSLSVDRALAGMPVDALVEYAERHSCGALLQRAVSLASPGEPRDRFAARLQEFVRRSAVRSFLMPRQIGSVVNILREAGVAFALLKGTARSYADVPDAVFFPSHDVDVLVPRESLDDAIAALRAQGYFFAASEREQTRFRRSHHHAAPLYPPSMQGWYVELHTQLAPPGTVSTATDWPALAPHFTSIEGPRGSVAGLDPFGTALHHAVHGFRFDRFRDVVVCALALKELGAEELEALQQVAARENRERVRMNAFFSVAAEMAGVPWPQPDRDVRAYLRWLPRREDMPVTLGKRTQPLEAWFAAGRDIAGMDPQIVGADNGTPLRVAGRMALAPFALTYAALLRR
jgi:hypothetical protein